MLLHREHIIKAMYLSTGDVVHALERSGIYDQVSYVDFRGMTTDGNFVYNCTYLNIDTGKTESANAYVRYNECGLLMADF